jgi:hypothetical protein
VTIQPDTKDWTWVLERPCPECGLESGSILPQLVPDLVRENAAAWQHVLRRPDVRNRPRPDVWSPLEYACHVRDVLRLYDERLRLMLDHDDPLYENWDQDATAVAERYDQQDPTAVEPELLEAAQRVADRFESLTPEQWQRTGRRSDGASFTIASFSRYFVHDVIHHLHDVGGDTRA